MRMRLMPDQTSERHFSFLFSEVGIWQLWQHGIRKTFRRLFHNGYTRVLVLFKKKR